MLLSDYVKQLGSETVSSNPAERRMTSRLFEYWNTLRKGQLFPSRSEFSVEAVAGLAEHGFSIYLDQQSQQATFQFLGSQIKPMIDGNINQPVVADARDDSLISLVTQHYSKVLALKAPVGFESEFKDKQRRSYLFRAVMCPFSEDGNTIDCIVGAITHKEKLSQTTISLVQAAATNRPAADKTAPNQLVAALEKKLNAKPDPAADAVRSDRATPQTSDQTGGSIEEPAESAVGLQEGLSECQKLVAAFQTSSGKSRAALYDTLERAYRFHFETQTDPNAFAALCAGAGIKLQDRAPFTGLIKLVFGKDHDKTRVSEYATCLACVDRDSTPPELFRALLDSSEGGIKALVKAERAARRGERKSSDNSLDEAKEALRGLPALAEIADPKGSRDEFVLVLARRSKTDKGRLSAIALLDEKSTVVDPVLKRAAKQLATVKKS